MKINVDFFNQLSRKKYLAYIRSVATVHQEKIQTYATLILSLVAFSFFGIFAIMPTLSTIAELSKKLDDSKFLNNQLTTKITAMSRLQQDYTTLSPDLPVLNAAIPADPSSTTLLGQIRTLAENEGVALAQIKISEIDLSSLATGKGTQEYSIAITAEGDYANLTKFYHALVTFNRILTISSLSLTTPKDVSYRLLVEAKAFYQP